MNPFFSVIIPAHNASDHIRKGLDSIHSQSFKDYELIVICDSCTDDTADIARSYGAIVREVEYHLDGLSRNEGLNIATGEWILFMDDDDWFLHEFVFQQLADMVGKHGEDVLSFSHIIKGKGYFRQDKNSINVPVWSRCWKRSYIGDTRFSFRHYWSDCDFHNKMMRKPHKAAYWDMPMYYYNWNRQGSISNKYEERELPTTTYQSKPAFVYLKESDAFKEE